MIFDKGEKEIQWGKNLKNLRLDKEFSDLTPNTCCIKGKTNWTS